MTDEQKTEIDAVHYPSFTSTDGGIGCDCGWDVQRTRLDQAVQDYAEHVAAASIEALAVEAESYPDDEDDAGGAVADWLRSRLPQNPSPAGSPAPTMDPSERANGGSAVVSRTGTGPAGEADPETEKAQLRTDVVDPAADALDRLAERGIPVPCDPDGVPVPPHWFRAYLSLSPESTGGGDDA